MGLEFLVLLQRLTECCINLLGSVKNYFINFTVITLKCLLQTQSQFSSFLALIAEGKNSVNHKLNSAKMFKGKGTWRLSKITSEAKHGYIFMCLDINTKLGHKIKTAYHFSCHSYIKCVCTLRFLLSYQPREKTNCYKIGDGELNSSFSGCVKTG